MPKIAIEFRQKFHKPVVVDMFCYRRHGTMRATSRLSLSRSCTARSASIRPRSRFYGKKLIEEGLVSSPGSKQARPPGAPSSSRARGRPGLPLRQGGLLDGAGPGIKAAEPAMHRVVALPASRSTS